jgi:ubiquinone/menaquinone biosynthesis C-methylase UbiE
MPNHQKAKIKTQSNLDFKIMSLAFKIRDIFRPRTHILKEANIKACSQVLDYGCGPGSYIVPVIKLIGNIGTLYALDVNPLAIEAVQRLASKKKLSNVRVILSNCDTGLPPASIDVVLLYDILHDLENRTEVLKEIHRVLKPEGILSVSDHHLEEDEIINKVIKGGLLQLVSKGKSTYHFSKTE